MSAAPDQHAGAMKKYTGQDQDPEAAAMVQEVVGKLEPIIAMS